MHLVDTGQVELHRILGGHDVGVNRVEAVQRRVERGGLPGSGRAGHQDHAERHQQPDLEIGQCFGTEAQLGHVELEVPLVEEPHDDLLAEEGRESRDPIVHLLAGHLDLDAAVLGEPALGDVELSHDLDARGDSRLQPKRGLHHVVEHAVHPVADTEGFLVRLDMDIRRPFLDGVGQDQVHQFDDRGVLGGLAQFGGVDVVVLFPQRLDVLVVESLHDVLDQAGRVVVLVDGVLDGCFRRHHRLHLEPGHELDIVDGEDVARVRHGDGEDVAGAIDGDDLVLLGNLGWDELNDGRVDLEVREVDGGDAVLAAEKRRDVVFADEPQLDEVTPDPPAPRLLLLEGLVQLLPGDQGSLYQHIA